MNQHPSGQKTPRVSITSEPFPAYTSILPLEIFFVETKSKWRNIPKKPGALLSVKHTVFNSSHQTRTTAGPEMAFWAALTELHDALVESFSSCAGAEAKPEMMRALERQSEPGPSSWN